MKTDYKQHLLLSASCLALGFFSIPSTYAASTCPGAQADPVDCQGTESRTIKCRDFRGNVVDDDHCAIIGMAPSGSRPCTAQCPAPPPTNSNNTGGDGDGDGDPLVFDLDGNGIALLSCADGVMFDIDNDGELDQTGWTDGRDGLLSIDENGNGIIDNQSELFGNIEDAAYQHLANYDNNNDGIIDEDDNIWSQLRMWVDRDTDGVTDRGELKYLDQSQSRRYIRNHLGIESINIGYNTVEEINAGHDITARGTFTRVLRGGRRVVNDVVEVFLDFFSGDS